MFRKRRNFQSIAPKDYRRKSQRGKNNEEYIEDYSEYESWWEKYNPLKRHNAAKSQDDRLKNQVSDLQKKLDREKRVQLAVQEKMEAFLADPAREKRLEKEAKEKAKASAKAKADKRATRSRRMKKEAYRSRIAREKRAALAEREDCYGWEEWSEAELAKVCRMAKRHGFPTKHSRKEVWEEYYDAFPHMDTTDVRRTVRRLGREKRVRNIPPSNRVYKPRPNNNCVEYSNAKIRNHSQLTVHFS